LVVDISAPWHAVEEVCALALRLPKWRRQLTHMLLRDGMRFMSAPGLLSGTEATSNVHIPILSIESKNGMETSSGKLLCPSPVPSANKCPKTKGDAARAQEATELINPFQKPILSLMTLLVMMIIAGKIRGPTVPRKPPRIIKQVHSIDGAVLRKRSIGRQIEKTMRVAAPT